MKPTSRTLLLAAAAALLVLLILSSRFRGRAEDPIATAPAGTGQTAADFVARSGGIYTLDEQSPWASAVAVRDGIIVAVGSNEEIDRWVGTDTQVLDLSGRMLLPGFHDAHVHPLSSGYTLLGCALNEENSVEALLERLADCAQTSDATWVQGLDFNIGLFPDSNPHKALLDALLPDRPAYLIAADGHSAWVNSRALELAGITAGTQDPPNGVIERDAATGEPTGTLREMAQYLVSELLPKATLEEDIAALRAAVAHIHSRGITSFIDASVGESDWRAYHALDTRDELNARVTTSLTYGSFSDYNSDAAFDAVLARRGNYATEHINPNAVKLFLDGVLEGETAALLEPYLGERQHRGTLNFTQQALDAAVQRFDAAGLQIHMHAIGDRAVRAGLDALQAARSRNGATGRRAHIAHLQLVHPDDLTRFAELQVTANFQPLWAYPDYYITDINLPAVGAERVQRMYPLGSLRRAGARIVGGSDWSVSSVNPLDAIETAVRRQDAFGATPGVLNADEAVDLATMLAAYTREAAWLMLQEKQTGVIAVGMRADLVVLDRNLFQIPAEEINEARVLLTIFDGKPVYRAP